MRAVTRKLARARGIVAAWPPRRPSSLPTDPDADAFDDLRAMTPARRRAASRRRWSRSPSGAAIAPLEAAEDAAPDGVEELLAGLNPEQRRAVTHGDGPLLVVAGAGTGKTQVITRRIAWLIATRRAKPSEILALTFTDQAADEMQVRVDQLVPYGYTDTAISTFHAFGDRLVREFALELGLPPDVRVLSRPETVVFLRERLFELDLDEYRPLGDPTRFLDALATLFSRAKDEDVSPDAYLAHAERLRRPQAATADAAGDRTRIRDAAAALAEEARRQAELARAYGALPGAARRERVRSTSATRSRSPCGCCASRPRRARRSSARFRYILVDEFQDTNRAQAELVALVAERASERDGRRRRRPVDLQVPRRRDQQHPRVPGALPAARGSSCCGATTARAAPILDAVLPPRPPQRPGPPGGRARASSSGSVPQRGGDDAPAGPPRGLRERRRGGGLDRRRTSPAGSATAARPRDVAILVRANAAADPILRALNLEGIPWRFSGTSGLYARPEVRLLLSFLRAIADLSSSVDVYALAASDLYGLGGDGPVGDREHGAPPEPLRVGGPRGAGPPARDPAARPGDPRRARRGSSRTSSGYVELAHERPAGEVLYAFLRGPGWLARLAAGGDRGRRGGAVQRRPLLRHHPGPVGAARRRPGGVRRAPPADADPGGRRPADGRHRPRRRRRRRDDRSQGEGPRVPGRVPAGPRDRAVPGDRAARAARRCPLELVHETLPEGDYQLQEERRLFYVGMTRARDELVLSHAADYGGQRARRVSPFVLEALDLPVAAGRAGGRREGRRRRWSGSPRLERTGAVAAGAAAARRRAAGAVVLRDRRLPDVPAQVQVRAPPARAARAAPLADLRVGAPRGGRGVPPPPRPRRRDDRGRSCSRRSSRRGRTTGSCRASTRRRAWRPAARRCAGSARSSWRPGAVRPRTSSASSASCSTATASGAGWTASTSCPRDRRSRPGAR